LFMHTLKTICWSMWYCFYHSRFRSPNPNKKKYTRICEDKYTLWPDCRWSLDNVFWCQCIDIRS
jgi:hypothetical protein